MKWIDRFLVLLALISLLGAAWASDAPYFRDWACSLGACIRVPHVDFWLPLTYDLSVGVFLSIVFYWLLVWLPQWRKRRRLRAHLSASYSWFRKEITTQAMFAASAGRSVNIDDRDKHSTMLGFREFFKSPSSKVHGNKWHDVKNGMTAEIRTDMRAAIALLRDDVAYVLNNTDIDDPASFKLLQGLQRSANITLLDPTHSEEDGHLLGLVWEVMTGWNWMNGYPEDEDPDPVMRLIDRI